MTGEGKKDHADKDHADKGGAASRLIDHAQCVSFAPVYFSRALVRRLAVVNCGRLS
jgi:hypothetical protein